MTQTGVLKSAWRHRLLVALIIVAFAVGAAMLSLSRADHFVAEATVVLGDPSASGELISDDGQSSSRSIANHIEVFSSGLVTSKAAEIAAGEGFDVTEADVAANTSLITVGDTDVITVSYADSDEEQAIAVANSIINAYDEIQLEQRRTENARILERLDLTEELLQNDLGSVQSQIDEFLAERDTEGQIEELLNRLSLAQGGLLQATDSTLRESLLEEIAELRTQMEALRLASEIESGSSELSPLLGDQARLQSQLTAIDERRTEVQLRSAIEGSGIAFFSPASITEVASGAGHLFSVLGGILLGGLVALGIAYALENRRGEFLDASEPEMVLGAPLLAEVPRWAGPRQSALPVRDDPRSLTAEAFRFAHASVEIRLTSDGYKSVNFVSATVGEGKSTLVANTALAAARTGKRVLLVDADFGSQSSSKLLVEDWMRPGLTDLVLGNEPIESAIAAVAVADGGGTLHVIGRGTKVVTAPDFFASPMVAEFMSTVESSYDVVLVDGPPLLQVAYASTIARLAHALVLLIPHGSRIQQAEALAQRVQLIGSPLLGYIYNMAPRQAGPQPLGGSMTDVLGEAGVTTRQARHRVQR